MIECFKIATVLDFDNRQTKQQGNKPTQNQPNPKVAAETALVDFMFATKGQLQHPEPNKRHICHEGIEGDE